MEYEVPPRYITGEFDDLGPKDGVYFARTDVESMFGYTVGFCTSVTAYNARGGQERIPAAALLVPSLAGNGPLQLPEPAVLERFHVGERHSGRLARNHTHIIQSFPEARAPRCAPVQPIRQHPA